MVHAAQSLRTPGSGCRLEARKPAMRASSTVNSRMVGFGGALGRTPQLRSAIPRNSGASSGTMSTAGMSGVSRAARAMSKTRHAVIASKAMHLGLLKNPSFCGS